MERLHSDLGVAVSIVDLCANNAVSVFSLTFPSRGQPRSLAGTTRVPMVRVFPLEIRNPTGDGSASTTATCLTRATHNAPKRHPTLYISSR
jgi:hypothetical protein